MFLIHKMVEIKKINYGIAFRIRDTIYINKKLIGDLYWEILKHELKHSSEGISLDLKEKFNAKLFWWILKNPSSWVHFSPFLITDHKLNISVLYLIIWVFIIIWAFFLIIMGKMILNV